MRQRRKSIPLRILQVVAVLEVPRKICNGNINTAMARQDSVIEDIHYVGFTTRTLSHRKELWQDLGKSGRGGRGGCCQTVCHSLLAYFVLRTLEVPNCLDGVQRDGSSTLFIAPARSLFGLSAQQLCRLCYLASRSFLA